jgi:F-type H+-transporting ATPase subunit epsilon
MFNLINLRILLPSRVFMVKHGVKAVVVQTSHGSVGFLPKRRDGVAALVPGILSYKNSEIEGEGEEESYVAIDHGILVKTGQDIFVSVRNAIAEGDLAMLQEAVDREFVNLSEQEKTVRMMLSKMESGFVRRFMEFRHD